MGVTRNLTEGTDNYTISVQLASVFADFVNNVSFYDEDGNVLTLGASSSGYYNQSGTYYDWVMSLLETSLNNYISDNNLNASEYASNYSDVITYNSTSDTLSITSLSAFAQTFKVSNKELGAHDSLLLNNFDNEMFGLDYNSSHFDTYLASIVQNVNSTLYEQCNFEGNFTLTDSFGNTIPQRLNMYTPIYYLMPYYGGNGTSNVAKHWRIRAGVEQPETSLASEVDLYLALQNYKNVYNGTNYTTVEDIDFSVTWGVGHLRECERTGTANENFADWVNGILKNDYTVVSYNNYAETITSSEDSSSWINILI